uniref:hypothetical protein n=1 Tax=Helicobacter sp. UBA3407 TaxID=1946588 RepID=UPI00260DDB57
TIKILLIMQTISLFLILLIRECKDSKQIRKLSINGEYEYNTILLNTKKYGVDSIINPKEYE